MSGGGDYDYDDRSATAFESGSNFESSGTTSPTGPAPALRKRTESKKVDTSCKCVIC
jgi:hypothetical protein